MSAPGGGKTKKGKGEKPKPKPEVPWSWLASSQAQAMAGGGLTAADPGVQAIIDRFPEFATMLQIPEVADLMRRGSQENWTPAFFQEQLWHTNWWKQTPESTRLWQTRKLVDPATAGLQSKQMAANIVGVAQSLGIDLKPAEIAWYTEFAQSEGWDDAMLTRAIVDTHKRNQFHAGTVNATKDSLRATAADYGLSLSESTGFKWATDIATGRQTQEGFEDWARNHAKAAFPTLAAEIDSGLNVRQIADPYMQIAADTLGLNPATMLLTNPKWQRALQGRDASGKITGPMTTQDWQRHIMTDPAYGFGKSAKGRSAALELRDSLSRMFGVEA